MSCSTCEKWDTCVNADNNCGGKFLIKRCFEGDTIEIDKKKLNRYVYLYKEKYKKYSHMIWLDARRLSGNQYEIRYIRRIESRGSRYICHIERLRATFVKNRYVVAIYYNGCDMTMSVDKFKELFDIDVTEGIKNDGRRNRCFITQ